MSNRLHAGRFPRSQAAALALAGAAVLVFLAGCQGNKSQSQVRTLPDGRKVVVLSNAPKKDGPDKPFTKAERAKLIARVQSDPKVYSKLTLRERRELARMVGGLDEVED